MSSNNNNNNKRHDPKTSRTSNQNSSEIRRNLTHKNNKLKVEIRKSKRNEQISKKRFGGVSQLEQQRAPQTNDSNNKEELIRLSWDFISAVDRRNNKSIIHSLQELFSKSNNASIEDLLRLEAEEVSLSETLSVQLCNALVKYLLCNEIKDEDKIEACRVLTNLAAASSSSSSSSGDTSGEDDCYYGSCWRPYEIGWCGVLVNTNVLHALIHTIQILLDSNQPSNASVALCQQSCWAIANIAADCQSSPSSSEAISQAISPLMSTLLLAYKQATKIHNDLACSDSADSTTNLNTLSSLCRYATWALSNIAKNTAISAAPFLSSLNNDKGELFAKFLLLHEQFYSPLATASTTAPNLQELYANLAVNWLEVTLEISTLLAFLTSKEDEAVDLLISNSNHVNSYNSNPSLVSVLSYRVASSIYAILNNCTDAHSSSLFCNICNFSLRIIGNIATACDGKLVQSLLTASTAQQQHQSLITAPTPPSIVHSLSQIIDISAASSNKTYTSLAINSCWVSSTLLYDAGLSPHHPSTLSCDILLPSLCRIVTSSHNTDLDLKREALSAMHNAISLYPRPTIKYDLLIRKQIILSIANTNTPLMIQSLIKLLAKYYDVECLHVSLQVFNVILRTVSDNEDDLLDYVKRIVLENDGLHILENVCDTFASCSSTKSEETTRVKEECANIAANLIDDFFDEEEY